MPGMNYELPEELEEAVKAITDSANGIDATEEIRAALAVIESSDDPSAHRIMADRLQPTVFETLLECSTLKDILLALAVEQSDLNELLEVMQTLAELTHYISEHTENEDIQPLLKAFMAELSKLSNEEYNDVRRLLNAASNAEGQGHTAPPSQHARNPFENNPGPRL